MPDILYARLGRRDKDIKEGISRLDPEIILSDIVRDGVRLRLAEMGVLSKPTSITPDVAQRIAREIMQRS